MKGPSLRKADDFFESPTFFYPSAGHKPLIKRFSFDSGLRRLTATSISFSTSRTSIIPFNFPCRQNASMQPKNQAFATAQTYYPEYSRIHTIKRNCQYYYRHVFFNRILGFPVMDEFYCLKRLAFTGSRRRSAPLKNPG